MKYLYKKSKQTGETVFPDHVEAGVFQPKIRNGLLLPGEDRNIKIMCVRLLFQIISRGKARIYYATKGGCLVHTSYVIPQCCKFPFLGKNDYEIGPCFTYESHRGQGIYPAMVRLICNTAGSNETVFYMIVDAENTPSIKGIEKAGFVRCGTVKTTRFTKKYQLEELF